ATELEKLRGDLRPLITPDRWPTNLALRPVNAFHLAACVGMHRELAQVVAAWPDDQFVGPQVERMLSPQYVVFGLGDARSVAGQMLRLNLKLKTPQHVRAWLACTTYDGLELVREAILAAPAPTVGAMMKAFGLVKAPEAAPIMLELS